MADFTQNSAVKSAVRKLAEPIADVDAFNTLVQSVITNNPFGCAARIVSGVNHPPIEKSKESYTARFVYQDEDAKKIGSGSESYSTVAGYKAGINAVLANTANVTAHGGTPAHDSDGDTFSATLRCYAANGEILHGDVRPPAGIGLVLRGRRHPDRHRDLGRWCHRSCLR